MAITVFDDFTTVVASGLGTATTGQVWSIPVGANWAVNSGSAVWSWNPGDLPSGPSVNATIAVVESGLVSGKTSATLVNIQSLPTFANGAGIVFRYVDTDYFWQCLLYKFLSNHRIRLQRTYAGSGPATVLDIGVSALSNGDVLSVGYCNDDFEVFVNGVSLGTYDASVSPQNYGTKSGLINQTGSWFGAYNQRFDDFTVETFGTCTPTYNCTGAGCVDPGDGTGTYATLEACLAACSISPSFNCVDGTCIDPGDGTGTFATLLECQQSGCANLQAETKKFDAGNGSSYYLVAQLDDDGNELRSKTYKAIRATGIRTNASAMMYGYDVNQEVDVEDLETGTRSNTRMTTRPQEFADSTGVTQSERKPISVTNAVLGTIRYEGDDTGNEQRDRIDEIVIERAIQGVRR